MPIRFDDASRSLELSVLDLVEAGAPRGDLVLETAWSARARLAAGREVHEDWQEDRGAADDRFRAEVRVRRQLVVGGWTAVVHGRVDGLSEEEGRPVVEEVKSTTLDAGRLLPTTRADWPQYVAQLELYLWMVAETRADPLGRLVLVSLLDGARHVLGVPFDAAAVDRHVRERLLEVVEARERRLAWLASRRRRVVPWPFDEAREGQEAIAQATEHALDRGAPLLLQAPTGLGKTAAVLHGALRHALRHDKQVFWATARTTQQRVVKAHLDRLAGRGLELRAVTVTAKEKACLNDVVACRPDRCRFARDYYDKLRDGVLEMARGQDLAAVGAAHEVCPYQLSIDLTEEADVVVGDYNYVFDPTARIRRHFVEEPGRWVVVVDEAHQLVDRARGYGSPRVEAGVLAAAIADLEARSTPFASDRDDRFTPFLDLARSAAEALADARDLATGPSRDGVSVAELSPTPWRRLADRIDELALDYARLKAEHPVDPDPWLDAARSILRFSGAFAAAGEETVHLVGPDFVGLLCLDPSTWLGPRIRSLGGFVGASATLAPTGFYRDLLGLDERVEALDLPSPFPPENLRVLVAPRVSTLYRDRAKHAEATARLIEECARAVPGNVAVYFPSFSMLRDIVARWRLDDREVLVQEPAMPEWRRARWLDRLAEGGEPVVLAAVLGGIFAEGIDLPPGALSAVVVAGPALPPVGLERDLLRGFYDERYGEGFRYASLVPGMTRVVQAAGRLIRRSEDRGVVVLVGRRFRWRDVASLLPSDWDVEVADEPAAAVASFWEPA